MNENITKQELIHKVITGRARLVEILSQIPQNHMTGPGVVGQWSVKDVISHVCWGEHKMVGLIHTHTLTDADLWAFDEHERDAIIYDKNKDRPLVEVLAEPRRLIQDLVAAIETLDEAELTDSTRFEGIPAGLMPWQFIAHNTYEHYSVHIQDLESWLDTLY